MVILTVFFYHSTRFFNLGDWHIKNLILSWRVEIAERVLATWMMPLAFIISGMSVFYALGKGRIGGFIKDKFLRLFVPLVVGIFTHSALQVYVERLSHRQFSNSFFDFYPHYFEGMYGFGGNFGWMGIHLWYVEMLFLFSLIFLPLFRLLTRGIGQRALTKIGNVLAVPGLAILMTLPLTLILSSVSEDSPWGMDVFGGWGIVSHAWFFLCGFLIASNERLQQSIQRMRWLWLTGAVLLTITQVSAAISAYGASGLEHDDLMAYLWILTFLGWARQYLNFGTPSLQRANEAVLPFYILHQPVLLSIGYSVVQWTIPDLAKWMIITASSFVITIALYEYAVRRINILRFLFGMKMMKRASLVTSAERQVVEAA